MYITTAKKRQKKGWKNKKYSLSQTAPVQSIKSNKDSDLYPINSLDEENKLHRTRLSVYDQRASHSQMIFYVTPSKLSKKRNKIAAHQTFFCFFPTKGLYQPNKVSLTEEYITREIPKR